MSYYECLDGPTGCCGDVADRPALSGSGMTFPRCAVHYDSYVERVLPRIEEVRRRYPAQAPRGFDPTYCGERWTDED